MSIRSVFSKGHTLTNDSMFLVREWQMVTVACSAVSSEATGVPYLLHVQYIFECIFSDSYLPQYRFFQPQQLSFLQLLYLYMHVVLHYCPSNRQTTNSTCRAQQMNNTLGSAGQEQWGGCSFGHISNVERMEATGISGRGTICIDTHPLTHRHLFWDQWFQSQGLRQYATAKASEQEYHAPCCCRSIPSPCEAALTEKYLGQA